MSLFLHPLNDGTSKCDVQKYPFANVAPDTYVCGIDECTKKVHVECYTRLVLVQAGKETLPPLPDASENPINGKTLHKGHIARIVASYNQIFMAKQQ